MATPNQCAGLSFRALAVDGRPLSPGGEIVIQAAKIGPTVFPIVFAAVVSRLMKWFALWKAERGSELGVRDEDSLPVGISSSVS
jgi:hypothetical protein